MLAIAGAALVLVAIVLPAEYGIDSIGIGNATGLSALRAPARTFEITDVIGGNETYREVEMPDFGDPVPLPNPDIYQDEPQEQSTRRLEITIPPEKETENKTVLDTGDYGIF